MLLRGEVIWQKQRGASGSCAWGSYQSPANPVLRDTTERLLIASKGRFDRVGRGSARPGEPGVATIPVSAFYAEQPVTTTLRLCFAKQDSIIDAAITRLAMARAQLA